MLSLFLFGWWILIIPSKTEIVSQPLILTPCLVGTQWDICWVDTWVNVHGEGWALQILVGLTLLISLKISNDTALPHSHSTQHSSETRYVHECVGFLLAIQVSSKLSSPSSNSLLCQPHLPGDCNRSHRLRVFARQIPLLQIPLASSKLPPALWPTYFMLEFLLSFFGLD